MQVHIPNVTGKADYPVRLNEPGNPESFAIIDLQTSSGIKLWVDDIADADRLIRAAIAAKDKLIQATGAQVRAAVAVEDDHLCPAWTGTDGGTVFCDREPGHPGSHHGPGPDEGSEVAWSDEPLDVAAGADPFAIPANRIGGAS